MDSKTIDSVLPQTKFHSPSIFHSESGQHPRVIKGQDRIGVESSFAASAEANDLSASRGSEKVVQSPPELAEVHGHFDARSYQSRTSRCEQDGTALGFLVDIS